MTEIPWVGTANSQRSAPLFPSLQLGPVQSAVGPLVRSSTVSVRRQAAPVLPAETERLPPDFADTEPLAPVTVSVTGAVPGPQSTTGTLAAESVPVPASPVGDVAASPPGPPDEVPLPLSPHAPLGQSTRSYLPVPVIALHAAVAAQAPAMADATRSERR